MHPHTTRRVLALAPIPPEKCAYALARYSRSADSILESIDWVRRRDSQQFLEHFYFQYGHASIADLGHTVLCFEGISELAAIEVEDEPLWDGQAKSSRYQDFAGSGFITPDEFDPDQKSVYQRAGERLLATYREVHGAMREALRVRLPKPPEMQLDAYERNIAARAFDVSRYLLFLGVPTNLGQVTSIRTLEKQIRRLRASRYAELRALASKIADACAAPPAVLWDEATPAEPVAPTLARHTEVDEHALQARRDLDEWARQNLPARTGFEPGRVDLLRPENAAADIAATLLYPVTDRPYRELYEMASNWSTAQRQEVIDLALRSRGSRDELLRPFRAGPYVYDLVIDIGAYRDLHRHRRCHQYRQEFTGALGFETPAALKEAGVEASYRDAMQNALDAMRSLSVPGSHYLLPFGARSRFLFKMDFAEAEYICRLRSSVKGHFSYREVAWEMKLKMEELEPELAGLIEATPPWIEDPLKR